MGACCVFLRLDWRKRSASIYPSFITYQGTGGLQSSPFWGQAVAFASTLWLPSVGFVGKPRRGDSFIEIRTNAPPEPRRGEIALCAIASQPSRFRTWQWLCHAFGGWLHTQPAFGYHNAAPSGVGITLSWRTLLRRDVHPQRDAEVTDLRALLWLMLRRASESNAFRGLSRTQTGIP